MYSPIKKYKIVKGKNLHLMDKKGSRIKADWKFSRFTKTYLNFRECICNFKMLSTIFQSGNFPAISQACVPLGKCLWKNT